MPKLLMLKGLPGSGKSTYAKELVNKGGWVRVNKDDLRAMMHDSKHSGKRERLILLARDAIINFSLGKGLNVVSDDTNFNPIHEEVLRRIAGGHEADFEIQMIEASLEDCISRDLKRPASVGEKVIKQMYKQYLQVRSKPDILRDKPSAFIFDIDGTLAHMKDRSPFEWHKVGEDKCNEDVARMLRMLCNTNNKIIICSGRDEVCRPETEKWLGENGLKYDHLYMRPIDDSRKDCIVKTEIYESYIKGNYNVLGVFDDRNQVVEMWRSLGLTCFQVAEGDF